MLQVVFFVLAVLLSNVGGHASCVNLPTTMGGSRVPIACTATAACPNGCGFPATCSATISGGTCPETQNQSGYYYSGVSKTNRADIWTSNNAFLFTCSGASTNCVSSDLSQGSATIKCVYQWRCTTQCEADSIACIADTSKVWDSDGCDCKDKGGGGPPLDGSCGFCQDTVDYSSFPPQVKHILWHCDSCTAGRGGIANEAAGCSIERIGLGSCEDNNECPSGVICMDDSTINYDCYATVGATVYVRNRKNGNVFGCEADGSCDMALKKVASGECRDPSHPPEDPNNSSSSGSGDSSSSGEPTPESSGDETCDMCDKLGKIVANTQVTAENTGDIANYTQETMNKAIDIYNQQTEMQIDLSHVRTNTENTATNTGNIDTKLSTTNNLLNDIKNKNWSPQIHVGSPDVNVEVQGDTNIVTVSADTSRSPFEILNFLKGMFGDTTDNYNANDTLGIGEREQANLNELDSLTSGGSYDGLLHYGDSITGAVRSVKTAIGAYKDSLNRGAFSDSVARWGQKLVDNGVLSGSGSNGCPSAFTRNFTWNMGRFGNVQIGSFGTFLCQDFGLGMTLWALARMVLRTMVAISCMLLLYRTVIGVDGGNNAED